MDTVSPVTRIIAQRKQMETTQHQLDAQREEYLRKEEMFRLREDNLRKRDLELQEALVLFNKFLKENEHKRRRAQEREREERRNKESKIKEIEYQLREIALKRMKLKEKRKLNKLCAPYQKFLNDFLADTSIGFFDDNPSIEKVQERFKVLERAEADLRARQLDYTRTADELRSKIADLRKKLFTQTLQLNNSIVAESQTLEQEVAASTREAARWRDEEAQILKQKALYAQLKMGIANIAKRCDAKDFRATLLRIIQIHDQQAHATGYGRHQGNIGLMTPHQIVTAAKAGVASPSVAKLPSSLTYVGQGGSVGANSVALLKRQPAPHTGVGAPGGRTGGGAGSSGSLSNLNNTSGSNNLGNTNFSESEAYLRAYGIDPEEIMNSYAAFNNANEIGTSGSSGSAAGGSPTGGEPGESGNKEGDTAQVAKQKSKHNPYGVASTAMPSYAGPKTARSRRALLGISGSSTNGNHAHVPDKQLAEAQLKAAVAGVTLPGAMSTSMSSASAEAELAQLSKWLKNISNRLSELDMMIAYIARAGGSNTPSQFSLLPASLTSSQDDADHGPAGSHATLRR